jgi:hypothetical protein
MSYCSSESRLPKSELQMEEEEIRLTSRKTQDDVVKQLVKKRVYFQWVCSPFYTIHFGVRFRTHARDRERNRRKKG